MILQVKNRRPKPLDIFISENPFDPFDRKHITVPYRKQRLSTITKKFLPEFPRKLIRLNGTIMTDEDIGDKRTVPGDEIIIVPVPEFGIGAAIAGVATWFATSLGFTSVSAMLWTSFVYMGLSIGAGYLVRSLSDKPSEFEALDIKPTYSWSPHTLQRQGLEIQRIYGLLRRYGNIVTSWTDITNFKEEIKCEIAFGTGPCDGIVAGTLEIQDQDSSEFGASITTYERKGTLDQTAIRSSTKLPFHVNQQVISGTPLTWTTPHDDFDEIEVTFYWQGYYIRKNGKHATVTIGIKVEFSEKDQGSWNTLIDTTYTAKATQQKATVITSGSYTGGSPVTINKGTRYDIRISTTSTGEQATNSSNQFGVVNINEVISVGFKHPMIAKIGIDGIAGEKLNGALQVSCEHKGRVINVWNGSSWTIQYSTNPAWVIWDLITRPLIGGDGGGTPYYIIRYDGLNPELMMQFLTNYYLAAQWYDTSVPDGSGGNESRFSFNGDFEVESNVWDCVKKVCRMCRSDVVPSGLGYDLLVEKQWTGGYTQLFSAANIEPGSFRQDWLPIEDRAVELSMTYKDKDDGYEMKPISYHLDSMGKVSKTASLGGFGLTSTGMSWRLLVFELEKNARILSVVTFDAKVDAIVSKRGDVINVVPPWYGSGKILSVPDNNQIQIDNTQHDTSSNTILIRVTDSTGDDSVEQHVISNINGDIVTVEGTFTNQPKRGDKYAFGPTDEVTKPYRIVAITQSGDFTHQIIAAEYHDELYRKDGTTPTIPIAGLLSQSASRFWSPGFNLSQYYLQQVGTQAVEYVLDAPLTTNLKWSNDTPSGGSIEWSATDGTTPILLDVAGTTHEITPGNTSNQFVYWDSASPTIFQSTNSLATATAGGRWIMAYNESGTAHAAFAQKVIHGSIIQAGTITATQITVTGLDSSGDLDLTAIGVGDLDDIGDGTSFVKMSTGEQTKLTGIESGADVTVDHLSEAVYYGATPPSHVQGRLWYNTTNGSYANYTLFRSTGAAWETVSDTTSQHASELVFYGATPPTHRQGRLWYNTTNGSYANYTLFRSTGAAWEVVGDVTAQHQADVQLANVTGDLDDIDNGAVYVKFSTTEQTKLTGVETGADVTSDHLNEIIYRGATPPSHVVGRMWYNTTNVSYAMYTLLRSTGAAWEIVGDYTAQHQADIALANVTGDLDDIDNGTTYAKMLASWRHTSDTTRIDGGKIWTNTVVASAINVANLAAINANLGTVTAGDVSACTLNVATADIVDLNVTNIKIADDATGYSNEEFTATSSSLTISSWITAENMTVTTDGNSIRVTGTFELKNNGVGADTVDVGMRIKEGTNVIYTRWWYGESMAGSEVRPYSITTNFSKGSSGSQAFTIEVQRTNCVNSYNQQNRTIATWESRGK
jgi:hypothetical protein